MATVVIGGQASGVGKTGVICALIAALPERRWTAIKITQCSHRPADGKPCDCQLGDSPFAISEEDDPGGGGDSSRYLAAGAERAVWVRSFPGRLGDAMPRIEQEMAQATDLVVESNSFLEYVQPDVYALVLSPCLPEFKPSARRYLERADAVLMATAAANEVAATWGEELRDRLQGIPQFAIGQGELAPQAWIDFVRARISLRRR